MVQITITRQADGTFRVQTPAGTSHDVSVPAGVSRQPRLRSRHARRIRQGVVRVPSRTRVRRLDPAPVQRGRHSQYFPGYPAGIRTRPAAVTPARPDRRLARSDTNLAGHCSVIRSGIHAAGLSLQPQPTGPLRRRPGGRGWPASVTASIAWAADAANSLAITPEDNDASAVNGRLAASGPMRSRSSPDIQTAKAPAT